MLASGHFKVAIEVNGTTLFTLAPKSNDKLVSGWVACDADQEFSVACYAEQNDMDTFYAIYKDGVLVRTVHTNSKASDTMERISGVFANGMIRRLAFSTTPATPYSDSVSRALTISGQPSLETIRIVVYRIPVVGASTKHPAQLQDTQTSRKTIAVDDTRCMGAYGWNSWIPSVIFEFKYRSKEFLILCGIISPNTSAAMATDLQLSALQNEQNSSIIRDVKYERELLDEELRQVISPVRKRELESEKAILCAQLRLLGSQ